MANTFTSPNMNLVIPVATVDPGPDWANNLNASLVIIDAHNHAAGSGVLITPQGINISIDLPFNGNNATQVRTVRFLNQPTSIDATIPANANDVGSIYEATGDLWYNNASAHSIQLTSGNSVVGAPGTITGLPVGGPAGVSYQSASGTFVFVQNINTAANIDVGTVIVRFPGSYPSPTGNFIALRAPSTLSSQINLTLPFPPVSGTQLLQIDSAGLISSTATVNTAIANNIGIAMTSIGANAIAASMTNTGADAILTAADSTGADILLGKTTSAALIGGKHPAVANSGTQRISIVRGSIVGNVVVSGQGFSFLHTGTGTYRIIFDIAFSDRPSIVATPQGNAVGQSLLAFCQTENNSQTNVYVVLEGSLSDSDFDFIAMGIPI